MISKIKSIFKNIYSYVNSEQDKPPVRKPIERKKAYEHFANLLENNKKITLKDAILDYENSDENSFDLLARQRNISRNDFMNTYRDIFNTAQNRTHRYGTFN